MPSNNTFKHTQSLYTIHAYQLEKEKRKFLFIKSNLSCEHYSDSTLDRHLDIFFPIFFLNFVYDLIHYLLRMCVYMHAHKHNSSMYNTFNVCICLCVCVPFLWEIKFLRFNIGVIFKEAHTSDTNRIFINLILPNAMASSGRNIFLLSIEIAMKLLNILKLLKFVRIY